MVDIAPFGVIADVAHEAKTSPPPFKQEGSIIIMTFVIVEKPNFRIVHKRISQSIMRLKKNMFFDQAEHVV